MHFPFTLIRRHARAGLRIFLVLLVGALPLRAQFIVGAPGVFDYGFGSNWGSNIFNGVFTQTLSSGSQTITFGADTTLPQLTFSLGGTTASSLVLRSDGTGARTVTLNGNIEVQGSTFVTDVTIGSANLGEQLNLALGGGEFFNVLGSNKLTILGQISGANGSITKAGTGKLVIAGDATYAGVTSVIGGELQVGDNGASGSITGDISLANGAALTFERSTPSTYASAITGLGTVSVEGAGALTLTGANSFIGTTEVDGGAKLIAGALNTLSSSSEVYVYGLGTLQLDFSQTIAGLESGTSGAQALVTLGSGTTLTVNLANGSDDFEGAIRGGGSVTKTGAGQQIFSGVSSDYTGKTTISGGALVVAKLANGGADSSLGASTNAAANLVIDGGTLRYSGSGDSTDRLFTVGVAGATIDAAGTGTIVFSNSGSVAFATPNTNASLTFDAGTNAGPNIFRSVIADNGTGVTTLHKNGIGQWMLTGANTFTGATDIASGTLTLANSYAVGNSSVMVGATGMLTFNGITSATLGSLSGTHDIVLENDSEHPAAVALTVGNNDSSSTYNGVLSGAGSLIKSGTGGFTLTGANTYTGATTINDGTLYVGNFSGTTGSIAGDVALANAGSAVLMFARGDTSTFSGVISGVGTLGVQGGGTLVLDGVSTFDGKVQIQNDSTLRLNVCNTLIGVVAVEFGNAASTLDLLHDQTVSKLSGLGQVITAKTLTVNAVTPSNPVAQFDGTITGGGSLRKTGAEAFNLAGANTYTGGTEIVAGTLYAVNASGSATGTGTVTVTGGTLQIGSGGNTGSILGDIVDNALVVFSRSDSALVYGGAISGTGAVKISNFSNGTITLAGSNSYSGGTMLNGGTLVVSSDANLGAVSGGLTFAGGTLRASSAFTSSRNVVLNAFTNTIDTNGVNLTFSGVFSDATTNGSLTKAGTGALTLSGDNTFSGTTYVTGGTLVLTGDNASNHVNVGAGAELKIGVGGTTGGVSGDIFNQGSVIINRSDDSTYAGNYSGSGSVTKQGAGHLFLTGSNSVANSVAVNAGYLDIGDGGLLGSLFGNVLFTGGTGLGGGELQFFRSNALFFSGTISGPGRVSNRGSGTTTLTANNNTYSGDTFVTAGGLADGATGAFSANSTFRVNAGGTLAVNFIQTIAGLDDFAPATSGSVAIAAAANLTIANAAANTFSGALSGQGFLNKAGAGKLTFAGTSTFNGTVSINAGTLGVGAANAFTANNVNVGTGTIFDVAYSTGLGSLTGPGTTTVAAGRTLTLKNAGPLGTVISGAGGVAFDNGGQSSGVSTITVNETYTGATTVNNGTLNLGAGGVNGTTGSVAGNVVLGNSSAVINFNRDASSYGYAGAISGGGSLRKSGSGTLTLSGANTYTGTTTVNGGTLRIGAANTLPTATSLSLLNGTALDVAENQTIGSFVNSFGASISIVLGKVFDVTLGNQTSGTIFEGVMSGAGGFEVGSNNGNHHAVTLTGDNTYTGGTTIDAGGALRLGAATNAGMVAGNIVNNGLLIFHRADDIVFNGVISGAGGVNIGSSGNANGAGDVRLTAANTYTGGTDIYHGGLFALNSTGSATGTGSVTVHGGLLAGTGNVAGHVDLMAGATIAPASSLGMPGTLSIGSGDFAGGAKFAFQIGNADGTSGVDLSLLNVAGSLAFNATTGSPFVIELYSVDSTTHAQGLTANFDPAQSYHWMFLNAAGGITGFSAAAVTVDTSSFFNSFTGGFGVSQSGHNLFLDYSPAAVPEPSTWALLATGLGVLLISWHRNRLRRKS